MSAEAQRCTFVPAVDDILLLVLDAPGVHQLGLAAGHQYDAALVLQGPHKGVAAHLPQPTPAHQVPHQLHHTLLLIAGRLQSIQGLPSITPHGIVGTPHGVVFSFCSVL